MTFANTPDPRVDGSAHVYDPTAFRDAAALAAAPANSIALLPHPPVATPPEGWSTIGVVKNLMGDATVGSDPQAAVTGLTSRAA